jgi:hypothetical protein
VHSPITNTNSGPPNGWQPGPAHPDHTLTPDPEDVAARYRQLRKAFEDGKNEPGAADFYYGEMEMRRHDRETSSRAERALLSAYWLVSGYGLRASRALGWLVAAMSMTAMLLMFWGIPTRDPQSQTIGTITGGNHITLHTAAQEPAVTGPWQHRFTTARLDKATRIVVNSVVFRSADQRLTTAGTYTERSPDSSNPSC